MNELLALCGYLYQAMSCPIYLYQNDQMKFCFPEQSILCYPPTQYINYFSKQTADITFKETSYHAKFASIRLLEFDDSYLIIGPISSLPYTNDNLFLMYKEYVIPEPKHDEFIEFINNIPPILFTSFINNLLLINYSINKTTHKLSDILGNGYENEFYAILENNKNHCYTKEFRNYDINIKLENQLLGLVESGNSDELQDYFNSVQNYHLDILANDSQRHQKNMFIATITSVTRAAIRGGLPHDTAFQLSNSYIMEVEKANSEISINQLMLHSIVDFTKRVNECHLVINPADTYFSKCIFYVRQNTNKHLTVKDVAEYVGYNRSYLSKKFKDEFGFDLSSFIMRCKLEDAKNLILHTEKSLSEISNYLCFANQSHFNNVFKKHYHMTPLQFKENYNNKRSNI